jgi:DNA-directed RNA polymerase II subunit RPB2
MDEQKIKDVEELSLKYIDEYFNANTLVDHQIDSCNHFYENNIKEILNDLNPIKYTYKNELDETDMYSIYIYIGGRNIDKIQFNSPMIVEDTKRKLYPNECRLKNITYATTIYYKIEVEFKFHGSGAIIKRTFPENEYYTLGLFPIMLKSNLCILNKLNKEICYQLGECRHDYGGYFIIDGKEKVIVPQEKFGDNIIYIRTLNDNKHDYSVEIRSISEDNSKPRRSMAIRRNEQNGYFTVDIPNVRMPVPLFIVIRALGIISDKDICKCILSDLKDNEKYLELLRPSINDSGTFYTQHTCLKYISTFLKNESINETHNVLTNYLLPHMGEMNYNAKALFLGYMTFEVLKVINGDKVVTDRDNYKFKRVETSGGLMKNLFTEYANIMYKEIYNQIEKEMYYNNEIYVDSNLKEPDFEPKKSNIFTIIKDHVFNEKQIEVGFKRAFKGDWGAHAHTKRLGVLQDLNRLSYNSFLSHLRKVNIEMDSSSKITGPHLLHGSQFGYLDPVDTPDGGNVGLHKHMTIMCKMTKPYKNKKIYDFLIEKFKIEPLELCTYDMIHNHYRLFINGLWVGMILDDPLVFKTEFIKYRRYGIIFDVWYNGKSNYISGKQSIT